MTDKQKINQLENQLSKERDTNHWAENTMATAISEWRDKCRRLEEDLEKSNKLIQKAWNDSRYYNLLTFKKWKENPDNY